MSINDDFPAEGSAAGSIPTTSSRVEIKPMNSGVGDEWILQQVKTRRSFYPINIRDIKKLKGRSDKDENAEELLGVKVQNSVVQSTSETKDARAKWTLALFDVTFCMVIATPLVVGYWNTTWSLMDLLISVVPGDVLFVGGLAIHLGIAFFKSHLHESAIQALAEPRDHLAIRIIWKIKQIFYTYFFGVVVIMNWRGAWIVFDEYFLDKFGGCMYMTAIMIGALALFRTIRNLIITPTSLYIDTLDSTFDFPTRYRTSSERTHRKTRNKGESN